MLSEGDFLQLPACSRLQHPSAAPDPCWEHLSNAGAPPAPLIPSSSTSPARSPQWGRGVPGTWCLLGPGPRRKLGASVDREDPSTPPSPALPMCCFPCIPPAGQTDSTELPRCREARAVSSCPPRPRRSATAPHCQHPLPVMRGFHGNLI